MRILGLDPALVNFGWGVIEVNGNKVSYLNSGIIVTSSKDDMPHRLAKISNEISRLTELYKPCKIAMEETFVNKNPTTSLKLGYVRGAVMALIGQLCIPFEEYKPNKIKKSVVGSGHAEKEQIKRMISIIINGLNAKDITFDEADSLAVAYTDWVN